MLSWNWWISKFNNAISFAHAPAPDQKRAQSKLTSQKDQTQQTAKWELLHLDVPMNYTKKCNLKEYMRYEITLYITSIP